MPTIRRVLMQKIWQAITEAAASGEIAFSFDGTELRVQFLESAPKPKKTWSRQPKVKANGPDIITEAVKS
jgi:hypothetical protein